MNSFIRMLFAFVYTIVVAVLGLFLLFMISSGPNFDGWLQKISLFLLIFSPIPSIIGAWGLAVTDPQKPHMVLRVFFYSPWILLALFVAGIFLHI